jgi:hypothetical protein
MSRIVPVAWRARHVPLAPAAVAALGAPAHRLVARLLASDDATLARLRGVCRRGSSALVVVLGEPGDLPWSPGVLYLGRDRRAPGLLVPTVLEPDVPLELVERATVRRVHEAASPFAILPEAATIVPCGRALPLDREHLAAFGRAA